MHVYLDNAATTKVDPHVAKVMHRILEREYGNPSSLHSVGEHARHLMDEGRKKIATALGAKASEIYFTSSGTESNNLALRGILKATGKKEIVTSVIEHPSVLNCCRALENEGYVVHYVPVTKDGIVNVQALQAKITSKTGLVTVMHVNNEIGTIQPIEDIATICKAKEVPFHVDAAQSFTKVPLDVRTVPVSAITLSAHKIHGPKGMAALYVREGTPIFPLLYGGHQERELRPGTENVAGIIGFAAAASRKQPVSRIEKLRNYFIARVIREIPYTSLNGSLDRRVCNNANICFSGVEAESLLFHLNLKHIYVSMGSACSAQKIAPSHVLRALGMSEKDANSSLRFSLSKYTTKKEIDYVVQQLKRIVETLRNVA